MNKTATYAQVVVDKRPKKEEVNRTRITAGGDRLEFQGDTSTESAGLETAKMVFNSVVSTPEAKFMTIDITQQTIYTVQHPKNAPYMHFTCTLHALYKLLIN